MLTFTRLLQPKITVQYPEVVQPIAPKHRGRLLLLYDEFGALKCETCFQCAAACPIECIDMGGVDTQEPLPRPLGTGRAVRRAPRGVRAAPLRAARAGPDVRPVRADRPAARSTPCSLARTTTRSAPSRSSRARRTRTGICRWRRSSTSRTRPARGTRSCTASPPRTRTCSFEPPSTHIVRVCRCGTCAVARQRPDPGRVPRAPRHGRRRREPGRRGAPRAGRLPRHGHAARRASRWTAQVLPQVDRRRRDRHLGRAARARRAGGHRLTMQLLQMRHGWPSILLARAGAYDPSQDRADFATAEKHGAWTAWRRAVSTMTPEQVIRVVTDSGLRGRGGGAFPDRAQVDRLPFRRRPRRRAVRRSPTASRPIRAPSSIARSWSATRTAWSRASRWRPGRSARERATIVVSADATTAAEPAARRDRGGRGRGLHRRDDRRHRRAALDRGPPAVRLVRGRRGDRAAARARGASRPARPAAAVPDRARVPRQADGREQRRDARGRARGS